METDTPTCIYKIQKIKVFFQSIDLFVRLLILEAKISFFKADFSFKEAKVMRYETTYEAVTFRGRCIRPYKSRSGRPGLPDKKQRNEYKVHKRVYC